MYVQALVCTHIRIHVTLETCIFSYMFAILNAILPLLFPFYNQQDTNVKVQLLECEAALPSAAHAQLPCQGHADCMPYCCISMLQARCCLHTTLHSLPWTIPSLYRCCFASITFAMLTWLRYSPHYWLSPLFCSK